ncbi:MAG: phosphomannomutase/phosphoglucomutase [Oscillospiraceae bacterium]|nr:phosphomannomutase/phosphoglucomutase [Oscillospiraceae bacterium]
MTTTKDYSKLRNESDIRGIAIAGVPGQDVNLTESACRDIARGFALWLVRRTKKTNLRVAVGRDSRLSGEKLSGWMADELAKEGIQVTDMGLASTPAMFMTTKTDGYMFDGAVMVTASHLPYNRNGYKFFTPDGGVEASDIKEMIELAETDLHTGFKPAEVKKDEFMDVYSKRLADMIRNSCGSDTPLTGLKIVVDAGNGAGGFYAEKVLKPLGADTTGSRFLDPDGSFPNHIPNPENKEAMASITEAVKESHADLGVIFDTDVDRAGAVLSDGSELNRNRLIAMLSAMLLRDHPHTTIVTDSVTSSGLGEFIRSKGGVHHRFRRGYRNVINESIRLNKEGIDSQLAIETSGHGAFKDNYFLDDGAYIVTRLIIELSRGVKEGYTLHSLIDGLREPAESMEFRMNIDLEDFKPYGNDIISALKEYSKTQPGWTPADSNYEGIRINLDKDHGDGWFLLRMSLHEPLMPLNIESDSVGGVKIIASELCGFLASYEHLDTSKLIDYTK